MNLNYQTNNNVDEYKVTTLERLKIELNNRPYYDDGTFSMYLSENDLEPEDVYDKKTMQKRLLYTVLDILESLSNDINIFRSVETEFTTVGDAYSELHKRLYALQKRIDAIPDDGKKKQNDVSFLFHTRRED